MNCPHCDHEMAERELLGWYCTNPNCPYIWDKRGNRVHKVGYSEVIKK